MLQRIRDRISGWIAGLVIVMVAGAFVLFGIEFYFEQSAAANQSDLAKVNGVMITEREVGQVFTGMQRQAMMGMGGRALSTDQENQLKSYALQSLITETALLTTLKKEGYLISLTQIKAMVEQQPDFQVNGVFSKDKFLQALSEMGVSPFVFFEKLQGNWIIQQATNGVADSAFVLPTEVTQFDSLAHQKRAFGYMVIPMQSMIHKTTVSEKDIVNYYHNNQKTYQTEPKVSVAYLVLSPSEIEKQVTVSDAEAKAYYESHLPQGISAKTPSFAAEKKNIVKLLRRQHVNQLLSDEASRLSDLTYTSPDSLDAASKALHLPIQTSSMMTRQGEKTGVFANPKVLEAVFSDSVFNSGNNSNPIAMPNGDQMVLRIAKKEPAEPIALKTVHDDIKKQLQAQQAEAQAGLLAYQLQQKIAKGVDPVSVAKENHLQWRSVGLMTANEKSSVPSAIVAMAFKTTVTDTKGKLFGSQAGLYNKQDYVVMVVSNVENGKSSPDSKTSAQLGAMWAQLYQHGFVGSIMKNATIKMMKNA
jgi:peptidyl-prolyl cis-trans isomerase D